MSVDAVRDQTRELADRGDRTLLAPFSKVAALGTRFFSRILPGEYDRTFLRWSSNCLNPFCVAVTYGRRFFSHWLPGEYDQDEHKLIEFGKRTFIAMVFVVCAAAGFWVIHGLYIFCPTNLLRGLAGLGLFCAIGTRYLGMWLQKNNYTLIETETDPKKIPENGPSIGLQNIIGVGAGYNLSKGGQIDFTKRLDPIAEKWREHKNPTVLVFNEVYDTHYMEQIIEKYQKVYPYIFCHLGTNPYPGASSGVMILSKVRPNHFENIPFKTNSWTVNRTFAILEIGDGPDQYRVVATHLVDGDHTELARAKLEKKLPKLLQQFETLINQAPVKNPETACLKTPIQELQAAFSAKQFDVVQQKLTEVLSLWDQAPGQIPWYNSTYSIWQLSKIIPDLKQYLHLIKGGDSPGTQKRKEQFSEIMDTLATRPKMPTIFAADANMEWNSPSERGFLAQYLDFEKNGCYNYAEPTSTNEMTVRWQTGKSIDKNKRIQYQERIDYLAPFKASLPFAAEIEVTEPVDLVRGFEDEPGKDRPNSRTSRSDHHGLRGRFRKKIDQEAKQQQ